MTDKELAVEAAMGDTPVPEKVSVKWEDFLTVCKERSIEYVEGKTVLQMKEDFLADLDKIIDTPEEETLSQLLVDIQKALVDGANIVGSPEDDKPLKAKSKIKGNGKGKTKTKSKEKAAKVEKPKKEKKIKQLSPKLGGVGMKPMCRELFGEMTKEQVIAAMSGIKEKLAEVYVKEGKGDKDYGLKRAGRIFYDIFVEKFEMSPTPKSNPVPGKKKEKKAKKDDENVGPAAEAEAEAAGE